MDKSLRMGSTSTNASTQREQPESQGFDEETEDLPPLKKSRPNSQRKPFQRHFNPAWECQFFFQAGEANGEAQCLICSEIRPCKKDKLERHFTTQHPKMQKKNINNSAARVAEVDKLKRSLAKQKHVVSSFLTAAEISTLVSYKIGYLLAQHKMPFIHSNFIKTCLKMSMEVILNSYPPSFRDKVMRDIDNVSLDRKTIGRRIELVNKEVVGTLKEALSSCVAFSVALDESTDIGDKAQLCIWVRYISESWELKENLLSFTALKNRTRGIDIAEEFWRVAKE